MFGKTVDPASWANESNTVTSFERTSSVPAGKHRAAAPRPGDKACPEADLAGNQLRPEVHEHPVRNRTINVRLVSHVAQRVRWRIRDTHTGILELEWISGRCRRIGEQAAGVAAGCPDASPPRPLVSVEPTVRCLRPARGLLIARDVERIGPDQPGDPAKVCQLLPGARGATPYLRADDLRLHRLDPPVRDLVTGHELVELERESLLRRRDPRQRNRFECPCPGLAACCLSTWFAGFRHAEDYVASLRRRQPGTTAFSSQPSAVSWVLGSEA